MELSTYDKLELLKSTIEQLYSKEGRSKSYIASLLKINRTKLSEKISEWGLKEAEPRHHLTPSNQKFLNKHRNLIKSRLDHNISITRIAKELDIPRTYLQNTIIPNDEVLDRARREYIERLRNGAANNIDTMVSKSNRQYEIIDIPGEIWKPIMGYTGYMVSNCGRIKNFAKRYKRYYLLKTTFNKENGREYVTLYKNNKHKNMQVANIVAHTFVNGYDEQHNTVNHKDGNVKNNHADNLEWVSQSENNLHSYRELNRQPSAKRRYDFKTLRYKKKYEFQTIAALARFMGKSETQVRRYLDNPESHNIELIR